MELSKENKERLETLAKAGVIAALGFAAVKVWRQEDKTKYIHYAEQSGSFFMGMVVDGRDKITQFTAEVVSGKGINGSSIDSEIALVLDHADMTDEEIANLESGFAFLDKESAEV